jgi:hypothetical protein
MSAITEERRLDLVRRGYSVQELHGRHFVAHHGEVLEGQRGDRSREEAWATADDRSWASAAAR